MNKVVVITGASSGLGLSLSKRFLQNRNQVFGISKTKRHWKTAFAEIGETNRFSLTQLNVTGENFVLHYLKTLLKRTGGIDVVINNAGYGNIVSRVDQLDMSEVNRHFKQNLLSAFIVSKCVLPILKKQKKGLIINISSMAGKRAVPGLFAYSASKFGILALSQCIAKENLEDGIKCITVCPGGMNTQMRVKIFGTVDAQKQQSTDFVANIIFQVATNQIKVESGGDIMIRHGKVMAINPAPKA